MSTTSVGAIVALIVIGLFMIGSLIWMVISLQKRNACGKSESQFCISYGCSKVDTQCALKAFRFNGSEKVCQPYILEKSSPTVTGAPPIQPNAST